jgi:NAD(P) transhydrogenase subunit alpha
MRIGIPKESRTGERRVAGTPETVAKLIKLGFEVCVESGAGKAANLPDVNFEASGATISAGTEVWGSDIVLKVEPPSDAEIDMLKPGAFLATFLWPAQNPDMIAKLAEKNINALAMDSVPRISRAQKMDALSSMANVSGYRAVIEASHLYGSFFTGQITAAGKIPPAKVLVIGAGVAGLASLAAARGLGAIVRAFDTRAAVKDQVESLGGEFLVVDFEEDGDGAGGYAKVMSEAFIKAEMDMFFEQAKEVDIVITTALIPGRPAPKLWEKRAVEAMKPGSVVVDLAASAGGNCELTQAGQVINHNGVNIVGYTDLTSRLSTTCSQLYGTNLWHLLKEMGGGENFSIDMDNDAVRPAVVAKDGEVTWPPPKVADPSPAAPAKPKAEVKKPVVVETKAPEDTAPSAPSKPIFSGFSTVVSLLLLAVWGYLRFQSGTDMGPASSAFLQHLTVFALAVFVGWQVVWSVTAALHTPLMSVTNAISGIIIIGGLLQANATSGELSTYLGAAAILFATINIAGGFLVTQRMLKMFRK